MSDDNTPAVETTERDKLIREIAERVHAMGGTFGEKEARALVDARIDEMMGDPEFRRKIRISSGNFQNLRTFCRLLWPPFSGLSFSFMSHKVLRWLGPFFLLLLLLAGFMLSRESQFYRVLLLAQGILLAVPFLDLLLRKIGIHIVFLRFITYFYSMNLALLLGFFKFLTRRETNVWKPTKRTRD